MQVHHSVIGPGLSVRYAASEFERVTVRTKEAVVPAWVRRPHRPATVPPTPTWLAGAVRALSALAAVLWGRRRAAPPPWCCPCSPGR